jgi:CDP-diglyceride synthetase
VDSERLPAGNPNFSAFICDSSDYFFGFFLAAFFVVFLAEAAFFAGAFFAVFLAAGFFAGDFFAVFLGFFTGFKSSAYAQKRW